MLLMCLTIICNVAVSIAVTCCGVHVAMLPLLPVAYVSVIVCNIVVIICNVVVSKSCHLLWCTYRPIL